MVVPADNSILKGVIMPPKTKQCQDKEKPSRKGCGGPKSYKEKAKNDPKQKKVSEMFRFLRKFLDNNDIPIIIKETIIQRKLH